MEFWMSNDRPVPARKRKQVINELEKHEEYAKLKAAVLSGRMRPMQSAIITFGLDDQRKLGFKFPQRTAVDGLRRLVKSLGLEADYNIHKYQTDSGDWAVVATYEPPITGRTGVPQQVAPEAPRRPGRPRKTA